MHLAPIISQLSCKWCQGIRGLYTKNDINHKFGLILISVMVCGLRDSLVDQGRDMKGLHLTFLHHFKVNSHSKCPYFLLLYHCIVGNPCPCCESDQAFLFPSCILSPPPPPLWWITVESKRQSSRMQRWGRGLPQELCPGLYILNEIKQERCKDREKSFQYGWSV